MNSLLYDSPSFKRLNKEIANLKALAEQNIVVSEESVFSTTKKVILGVLDRINKHALDISNSILSALNFKGVFDKLVFNSPLEDYEKLHGWKILAAVKANSILNKTIKVPKPRGMTASYEEVLTLNRNIFKELDMEVTSKSILAHLNFLNKALHNQTSTSSHIKKIIDDMELFSSKSFKKLTELSAKHDTQFNGNPSKDEPVNFTEEFGDAANFNIVVNEAKKVFVNIIKAGSIKTRVNEQSEIVRQIVAVVDEKSDIITSHELKRLIHFFDYVSACYQLYGAVCLTHIAVENNLLHVMKELVRLYMDQL